MNRERIPLRQAGHELIGIPRRNIDPLKGGDDIRDRLIPLRLREGGATDGRNGREHLVGDQAVAGHVSYSVGTKNTGSHDRRRSTRKVRIRRNRVGSARDIFEESRGRRRRRKPGERGFQLHHHIIPNRRAGRIQRRRRIRNTSSSQGNRVVVGRGDITQGTQALKSSIEDRHRIRATGGQIRGTCSRRKCGILSLRRIPQSHHLSDILSRSRRGAHMGENRPRHGLAHLIRSRICRNRGGIGRSKGLETQIGKRGIDIRPCIRLTCSDLQKKCRDCHEAKSQF